MKEEITRTPTYGFQTRSATSYGMKNAAEETGEKLEAGMETHAHEETANGEE